MPRLAFPLRHVALMLQDRALASALREALSGWPGKQVGRDGATRRMDAMMRRALAAAGADLERHPSREFLFRFIRDDRDLELGETGALLEMLYSHMVNRFKGDLAEILALTAMEREVERLVQEGSVPLGVRLDLAGECPGAGRHGWLAGPDGLLYTDGDASPAGRGERPRKGDIVIHGVVEIKSYPLSARRALPQLLRHRERLRHGLRLGDRIWPPGRIWFSAAQGAGQFPMLATGTDAPTPAFFLVRAPRHGPPFSRHVSERVTVIDLPVEHERLMSAGYSMTEWFAGELGARVFVEIGSPWPEMTPEEAGFNRLKEGLYHALRTLGFALEDAVREDERRRLRRWIDIATRLYNAYGWGLAEARRHRGMLWSVPDPGDGARLETLDLKQRR